MIDLIGIGKRVKTARTEHKLTREKLAEIVNVTPHYIYEIERGMKAMSLETLANISSALELSSDYILFGKYHNPDDSVFAMLEELSEEKRLRAEKAFAALLPYLKQKWGTRSPPVFYEICIAQHAFKEYAKKYNLHWGFVRDIDEELYINNTIYTEDMSGDNWISLDDVLK